MKNSAHQQIEKIELLEKRLQEKSAAIEKFQREVQIELALERVRSRALAMHFSTEINDVVGTLYAQYQQLGFQNGACCVFLMDRGTRDMYSWVAGFNEKQYPEKTYVKHFNHTVYEAQFNAWEEGKTFDTFLLAGDEKKSYDEYLFNHTDYKNFPQSAKDFMQGFKSVIFSLSYMKYGALQWGPGALTKEQKYITLRFAKVFEQAYTRFLDLQKAEEQARESQIELGLERVRAKTMAMRKSDELSEIVKLVYQEFEKLQINNESTDIEIGLINEDTGVAAIWAHFYKSDGSISTFNFPLTYFPGTRDEYKTWKETPVNKRKNLFITNEMAGEIWQDFLQLADGLPELEEVFSPLKKAGFSKWITHNAYFSHGLLTLQGADPYAQETLDILRRFAVIFEQTYTRFLDLQKAEAQALRAEQDVVKIKAARKRAEDALNELQITQKQLVQSEKMASLGELTAGIAHEIQNPLNFVNNFSDVNKELVDELQNELKAGNTEEAIAISNDIKDNEQKINHHGKRADAIVKGMLQHSRKSSGQKELTDINALCDEYLRLSFHGLRAKDKSFNADFTTGFDKRIGKINIIPQDIGRVLLNLYNNAFYACAERRRSSVNDASAGSAPDYQPTVSVSTKKLNDKVEIRVSDNGNGIPQNIVDKIFQPFFTTKPTGQGTGLGLSLSYDIIKAHGGEISVWIPPMGEKVETKQARLPARLNYSGGNDPVGRGEGSEFIFQLPIV